MRALYICEVKKCEDVISMKNKLILVICILFITTYALVQFSILNSIPNEIKIFVGEEKSFNYSLPMDAEFSGDIEGALSLNSQKVPSDKISINLSKPFSISSTKTGQFEMGIRFLGGLFIKNIDVEVLDVNDYIPCGNMIGVTIYTQGVLVLGSGYINNDEGKRVSPCEGKLITGDYLQSVNGMKIDRTNDLIKAIQSSEGKNLIIEYRRNDKLVETEVSPIYSSEDHEYKIGIWVRDSTQGIGTLTYVNPLTNSFGALGHGISDIDSGQLIDISDGSIVTSITTNIIKGEKGDPGEISGIITLEENDSLGQIKMNTKHGLYGVLNDQGVQEFDENEKLQIGFKHDINLGKAVIRSNISGEMKDYEIEIDKIFINDTSNKSMIIQVIDKELLNLTNGIVQGMSGSPIIQGDKLIGAVTHVFVQDSTKGYGTFIENMLLEE